MQSTPAEARVQARVSAALVSISIIGTLVSLAILYRTPTPSEILTSPRAPGVEVVNTQFLGDAFAWDSQPDRSFRDWETLFS